MSLFQNFIFFHLDREQGQEQQLIKNLLLRNQTPANTSKGIFHIGLPYKISIY